MILARIEKLLLFLVILFLPTQLGLHFWPKFSYIYSLKIDYLSPTLYFWDILAVGFLIVWLLGKPKVNMFAANIFLFFLLTQGLSIFGAENIGAGLVRLQQYGLVGLFGVFLASQDFKSLSKKIYLPLSLGILGESCLAILQFIKGSTIGLWVLGERTFTLSTPGIAKFNFYGMEFLRPYATFPHPNVLAGYLVVMVYGLWFMVKEKKTMLKIISAIGAITVFLTMSRTAILAGFILAVVILQSNKFDLLRSRRLIFIAVLLLILSPILFTRFTSLLNFDNLTLLRREELAEGAWQMFSIFPFFGVGLNNFIPAMAGNFLTGPSRFLQPVHNIFLLVLSETGFIGLIGLISLIGFPLLRIFRLTPKPYPLLPQEGRVNPILLWFIILFLGLFDHYFLTLPQGYRLFFLVWGLSFTVLK